MATTSQRTDCDESFAAITQRILKARQRASWAVNREMLALFWKLGRDIVALEATESRSGQTVDQLAAHLRSAFSETICFSNANLQHMRAFAKAWPDFAAVESVLMRLPWEHHLMLLSKLTTRRQRLAYARRASEQGWSSSTLAAHIERRRISGAGSRRRNLSC